MNTNALPAFSRARGVPVWVMLAGGSIVLFSLLAEKTAEVEAPDPGVPVGTIVAFAGNPAGIPKGWLLCDGRELPIRDYDSLFSVLQFGWGRGRSGTFCLPDLRGRFLRGVDLTPEGQRRDPDRETRIPAFIGGNSGNQVGSVQEDEVKFHSHSLAGATRATGLADGDGQWLRFYGTRIQADQVPAIVDDTAVYGAGGAESRPKNAYVHWIIKVQ